MGSLGGESRTCVIGPGRVPYSSKFSRSNNFVIFVRCKLITKFLSTKNFTPMGVSIRAAMNHE